MLRQMLKDDFGKDLRISGGFGNKPADPIVVEPQSAHDASWTELEVVRCIYRGSGGWRWRMIGRSRVEDAQTIIEKLSCDVWFVKGDQNITQKRNFYFDISQVNIEGAQTTPDCFINVGLGTGMVLPYQLGWCHFNKLTTLEIDHPGLGVTVQYSSPDTKLTVYIYNKGEAVIDGIAEPEKLSEEFLSVWGDILAVNPSVKEIAEKVSPNLIFRSFDVEGAYSVVTLSTAGNHFIKLRATLDKADERYTVECFWESVNALLAVVV